MKSAPDRGFSRQPAVLWGAVAFVCLAVLFLVRACIGQTSESKHPELHPPYHTHLQLTQVLIFPYRLRFIGHDFDPNRPAETSFQINTIDRSNRAHFVKLGDKIPDSKFKVTAFEHKEIPDSGGTKKDVSALTVTNEETGQPVVLPIRKVGDFPDRQAIVKYNWIEPGGKETPPFAVRPGGSFTLPPDRTKTYKLIEIEGQDAIIELPDGTRKTLTIPK